MAHGAFHGGAFISGSGGPSETNEAAGRPNVGKRTITHAQRPRRFESEYQIPSAWPEHHRDCVWGNSAALRIAFKIASAGSVLRKKATHPASSACCRASGSS